MKSYFRTTRYACAVLLIASSIALAFYQVSDIDDVANGVLMYIAQAFLLAGSIFGLEYYVKKLTTIITHDYKKEHNPDSPRDPEQQSVEYTNW